MRLKNFFRNNEYGVLFQILLLLIVVPAITFSLNLIGVAEEVEVYLSACVIVFVSMLIVLQVCSFKLTNMQRLIILVGYGIRVLVLYVDIYAADKLTILHSGDDALGYWKASTELYEWGSSRISSSYSQILNGWYHIFGENRVLAQYVNVLYFVGTLTLLLLICRQFQVHGKAVTLVLAYICFLPNYICISAILLRESMMIFFGTLSLYIFIQWMRKDRMLYLFAAFIAAVPAIILHSGAIGMWGAFLLIGMFWSPKKQKIEMSKRTLGLLLLAFAALAVMELVPAIRQLLMNYLPTEITIETITGKFFEEGGSDYLMNLEVHTWGGVAFWTVIRAIYFVLAPMPTDWRGISDVGAFVIDSLPTLVLLGAMLHGVRKGADKNYVLAGILPCIMICGIFAWGVSNAGTAMRHRSIMVGIFAIAYVLSQSQRKSEKKNKE